MITPDSAELLRLSAHWERGTMPFAGGLYDQPAILEHAVTVIRDEEARIAAEHAKRQKNKPW